MSHPVELAKSEWMMKARGTSLVHRINAYLASPLFISLVCAMTVIANVFGAELYVYSAFILFGLYISFFGDDYLPVMPMVVCSYIAPSLLNNPGRQPDSIFYPKNGGIYLLSMFLLFVVSVVIRLSRDKKLGGKNFLFTTRRFQTGMLILGGAYVLAGAFSGKYFDRGINNLAFALIQFISIYLAYWFFCGAVRWENARKDYFAFVGFGAGIVILCEILNIYLIEDVIRYGVIDLQYIASGWGNANNIGCMLAMMVPFAFYLARRPRGGAIYCFLGVVLAAGVFFTCSRASILGVLFAGGVSFFLILKSRNNRKANIIVTIATFLIAVAVVLIFHETFFSLFYRLIDKKLDSSDRDLIYYRGWKEFLNLPVFGGGFYPEAGIYEWSELESFKAFFPPRWHSTVIQLLASCGVTGFAAYMFHRLQTLKFFWERRKTDIIYIGLSILTLLLMSLLDCHMFNIGPVLFYSMALAFAEKIRIGDQK